VRLDRNKQGRGKYAIINLRKLEAKRVEMATVDPQIYVSRLPTMIESAIKLLESHGLIEYGEPGTENEFFVLKLKDQWSRAALYAYADAAINSPDPGHHEYANDVGELADRSGIRNKWCKRPD
jgi:hypothetical protein